MYILTDNPNVVPYTAVISGLTCLIFVVEVRLGTLPRHNRSVLGNVPVVKEVVALGARRRKEGVAVSFHYLVRQPTAGDQTADTIPFSSADFDHLCSEIQRCEKINVRDDEVRSRISLQPRVDFLFSRRDGSRHLVGTYQNFYSGHAFDNHEKGKIAAGSFNMRPFHFLLYLSESGRIYVATQYIGNYGGYTPLQDTLMSMILPYGDIRSRTFRLDSADLKQADAKEVKVTLARNGAAITERNVFRNSSVLTFKKNGRDDGFEKQVRKRILNLFGSSKSNIKAELANVLNENELLAVNDEDIADCTVIARFGGRTKTIYMFDPGTFATKFPIEVPLNSDGHPETEPTIIKIKELLQTQIVSKAKMFNLLAIIRGNRATFYNYRTGRPRSQLISNALVTATAIMAAYVLKQPSDEFLNGVLTAQSILAGFGFNVLFFLLSSFPGAGRQNGESIEGKLRSERAAILSRELFYNISYFNVVALLSVTLALAMLVKPSEPAALALVNRLATPLPQDGAFALQAAARYLISLLPVVSAFALYFLLIESGYSFARTISRLTYYFQQRVEASS